MYDIVIKNGIVIDTGLKTMKQQNIGITGSRITYVGDRIPEGRETIDAGGRYVSPGFIDVHGHIDGYAYSGELSVCQGITTSIGGNCGLSPVDIKKFFDQQNRQGFSINQLEFIGHTFSLRNHIGLTDPYQKATTTQIDQMAALADQALKDGACGISFGLDYAPGTARREILELSRLSRQHGKLIAVHTRLFTDKDLNSLYEMLSIAKETGVRLLFSHFVYQYGNGCVSEALRIIDEARNKGADIHIDSGMYTDWSTYIGTETYSEDTIRDNGYVFGDFVVATGKYTGQLMTREIYHLLRQNSPDDSVICFTGNESEIYEALMPSYAMPSTDIGAYAKGEGHPQIAGTFPKYLIKMVKETKRLSLEEAIYKATLLPAALFGIKTKGIIKEGFDADLLILDINTLKDNAAFPNQGKPDAKPDGIDYVLVNGQITVQNGCFTKTNAGQALKSPSIKNRFSIHTPIQPHTL